MTIFKNILKIILVILFFFGMSTFYGTNLEIADSSTTSTFSITIIPAPQCFDGQDNDGDGLTDFLNDPDCDSYTDDDESPDVPDPPPGGGGGGGTILPPETGITFSGRAYPLSNVTILKDGEIVLSTIAGPDAKFSATIADLSTGSYNFTVTSIDSNGLQSFPFSFPVFITLGSTTEVSGIFLSPTIDVNKIQVRKGDDIVIFGQTVPSSDVTIEVNSEHQIFVNTVSDSGGVYLYNFNSAPLELGGHDTQSKTNLITGEGSGFGRRVAFAVGNENIIKEVDTNYCNADLNSDGRVNLIDFSIAAFWYGETLTNNIIPLEIDCLNGDGKINLIDFSIMAFYWTG